MGGFSNVIVLEKKIKTLDFKRVDFFLLLMSTTVMCPLEKASYIG